jgi:hypothetical protein
LIGTVSKAGRFVKKSAAIAQTGFEGTQIFEPDPPSKVNHSASAARTTPRPTDAAIVNRSQTS